MHGHMFGGVLLRLALEQAHACVRVLSPPGSPLPELAEMLDIHFRAPVLVEEVLELRSAVLDTSPSAAWVAVEAGHRRGLAWEECATFHFHFRVGAPDFPAVVPFSVADMLQVVRQQRIRESWAQ